MKVLTRVTKGIIVSFLFHILFLMFIIKTDFDITFENFTVMLVLLMAAVTFYSGIKGKKLGFVEGIIISLGTAAFVLFYLNQRIEMDWVINRYLIGGYVLIGFISSLIGSFAVRKKK